MINFLKNSLFTIIFCCLFSCNNSHPTLNPLHPGDTILAFGDSITYGTGATPETSYPRVLEKIIGFKVINAGVPGEETRDSLNRIAALLEQNRPKLVIVCLGGNDLLRKRDMPIVKENLKNIIQTIQKQGAQVVLIGVPRISYNLEIPSFYAELGDELYIPVDNTTYRDLIKNPELKADYIHLNANGYKLLAEKIADLLKKQGALK